MNVLSLFDGMGCGAIALREVGINVEKYYASEIDKFAIMQTNHNFPGIIHLGSVLDVDVSKLDRIDLLIAGSPCQSFSFAGKRNGMTTTENEEIYTLDRYLELKSEGFQFEGQSYLFWEYMRILTDIRKYNPDVKFLLENVEMGDKWERVLSEAIGVFGVHINSALVSAQNRKRIYWTNIRVKEVGLFGELHSDIPQPEDEGILLKDILEEEVDEKYYLSEKMISYFNSGSKSQSANRVVEINGKTQSLMACDYKGPQCIAQPGREPSCLSPKRTEYGKQIRKEYEAGIVTEQRKNIQQLEPNLNGKTNTITTVQKDNLILLGNLSGGKWDKTHESNRRVYSENGKMQTIQTMQGGNQHPKTMQYDRIRRLTPGECARLQTIPNWYEWIVSETQQYKMLGNGWTVKVIMHILQYLNNN